MNRSVTLPLNTAACSAGAAFMQATAPAGNDASEGVILADGTKGFLGFITRNVLAAIAGAPAVPVPLYAELAVGAAPSLPLETSFSAGLEGSVEDADEYEAETPFLCSGSGASYDITADTPLLTRCSFKAGMTCIASGSGIRAEFYLSEIVTAQVSGSVRGRFVRLYGDSLA